MHEQDIIGFYFYLVKKVMRITFGVSTETTLCTLTHLEGIERKLSPDMKVMVIVVPNHACLASSNVTVMC